MLRDLGKTFRLRPSCGRSAGLPAVLALLALSAFTRAAEVPVLALPAPDLASAKPENRSLVSAIESAAAAGLPSLVESLGEDARNRLPSGSAALRRVRIALATARIQRSAYAEAEKILREIPGEDADKNLRLALAAYGSGKIAESRAYLSRVREGVPPPAGDLVWRDIIEGLIAAEDRRENAANQFFNSAADKAEKSKDRLAAAQVTLLRKRMLMRIRPEDTGTLDELGKLIDLPDSRQNFQLAKVRAFARFRAGDAPRAIAILNAAPVADTDLVAERDLLVGLLYGRSAPESAGRNTEGRVALLRVVESREFPGSVEMKSAALAALYEAVVTAPPGELVSNANTIYGALTAILSPGNFPAENSVADLIYFTRARILLIAGAAGNPADAGDSREKAEASLHDLLEKFPGSALRADALRLTADLAWQSGAYRKAADALDKLKDIAPGEETDKLRLIAADCYFLNRDWANAAAGYAGARKNLRDDTARGEALVGEVRSLIADGRVGPDPAAPGDNATKSLAEASASGSRIPAAARLRAGWLLADALRKAGEYDAAMVRVDAALASGPDAGMRVRFLWLRAMLELALKRNGAAATTAGELARLVESPSPDTPGEIRENASAILAQTALLKARALLGDKGLAGAAAGFAELRAKFPDSPSAADSYLVEGRFLSANALLSEKESRSDSRALHEAALKVFKAGYDKFKDAKDPELFDYAVASLFEAANEAITLADSKAVGGPDDPFNLLKELTEKLSALSPERLEKSLFFRARRMQGDILRMRGEFDSALKVYENLITMYPDHGDRMLAELAKADCRCKLGDARPEFYALAIGDYNRLVNLPDRPADLAAEAAFKRAETLRISAEAAYEAAVASAEAAFKQTVRSIENTGPAYKAAADKMADESATALRIAQLARADAAKTLFQTINDLLKNPAETAGLKVNGRYWIARGLLLVSELYDQNQRPLDARNAAQRLLDYNADLKDGTHRLPFAELAREQLKKLSGKPAATPALSTP